MKIEKQVLENHHAKLTVEVEPELFEKSKYQAARKFAERVKIPGFRPGKAPYQVVLRQVGEANVIEQALEILVDEIYPKILDEAGVKPYAPGKLEKVVQIQPPILEFDVPLAAEVTLGDYRSIRKPYRTKKVTKKQVDGFIETLRASQAVLEPVERPAQEGDMVTVFLSATEVRPEDNQGSILLSRRSYPFIIHPERETQDDEKRQDEWPFPGFSRNLLGLSAGDEKQIQYSFPEDALTEAFQGRTVEFQIVVDQIKSRKLPELNDELAASFGEYSDLAALREDVKKMLEERSRKEYDESYNERILDEAIKRSEFKYTSEMLENELDDLIESFKRRLEEQRSSMELYLKARGIEMEKLRKEFRPMAEDRLKRSLFLLELAKAENIKIEEEELKNETLSTMEYLARNLPEKEVRQLANERFYRSLAGNVMVDLLHQRALERFRDICSGKLDSQTEPPQAEMVSEGPVSTVQEVKPARKKKKPAVNNVQVTETETNIQTL